MKGIMGAILEVDLSTGEIRTIETNEKWIELYGGGAGYATRVLYDMIEKTTDPLSPENPLIIMTGPFVGVVAFSPKTAVVSRSPLTGFLGKSMASGGFGIQLKKAGFDGVIIKGKASKPVYLSIIDGKAELRDASHLWGKGVLETAETIKKELNDENIRVATIGPAGENLVKIAAIVTDQRRVFGRTGLGAVMGSKKLKAIAVKGTKEIEVADSEKLRELNKKHLAVAPQTPRGGGLRAYGTGGGVLTGAQKGNLPIKNWTKGVFEGAEKISGQTIMEKYRLGSGHSRCGEEVLCSIQCERRIQVKDEKYGEYKGKGPEYETLAALGSLIMVDDPVVITVANNLCDDYGLDTISTGGVIAWAMEAYEKGLLTEKDVGFPLKWGDGEAVLKLIHMIAKREGFGNILAEGSKRAAESINKGSEKFAIHVKGMELPMHHPRLYHTMGLVYATSNRGACHLQGMGMHVENGLLLPEYGIDEIPKDIPSKVKAVVIHQDLCAFSDAVGLCKFGWVGIIDFNHIAEVYTAVTGIKVDKDDILEIGERIWYLERLLNIELGLTPKDDILPERFVKEPLNEGPAKGLVCPIDELLQEFYKVRELDPNTGKPKEEKIVKLGIDIEIK